MKKFSQKYPARIQFAIFLSVMMNSILFTITSMAGELEDANHPASLVAAQLSKAIGRLSISIGPPVEDLSRSW